MQVSLSEDAYVKTSLSSLEVALLLLVRLQNHKVDYSTVVMSKIQRYSDEVPRKSAIVKTWNQYKCFRGGGDDIVLCFNLRNDISFLRKSCSTIDNIIAQEECIYAKLLDTNSLVPISDAEVQVLRESYQGTTYYRFRPIKG
ncbi:hypothetical protein TWF788_003253 [Orbilia oligospora]|uniref:Uncharacterized protein n=1 Tax=Orbilia oligospora TaxID=2813651 RepID=A0A7C8Q021_ORBOL|nr:hypothetical protein TWF788_003253 [Orbilia oligospora]